MKTCTFAGHREVFASGVEADIDSAIETILANDLDFAFYTGGMGEFDSKCSAAVRKAKRTHPEKDIKLFLVEPYMKTEINEGKDYYEAFFDDVLVPIELAEVHYKKAITQRNKWMIDRSDYLIAFVHRDFGGAYETMKYASVSGRRESPFRARQESPDADHIKKPFLYTIESCKLESDQTTQRKGVR